VTVQDLSAATPPHWRLPFDSVVEQLCFFFPIVLPVSADLSNVGIVAYAGFPRLPFLWPYRLYLYAEGYTVITPINTPRLSFFYCVFFIVEI